MKENELTPQTTYTVLTHRELPMSETSGSVWNRMFNRAWDEARKNQPKPGETVIIQMLDGPRNDMQSIMEKIHDDWRMTAARSLPKEVADLSDKEKFCIAYCAGVEIEPYQIERNYGEPVPVPTMNWRTKKPVGIVKEGKGFSVFVK